MHIHHLEYCLVLQNIYIQTHKVFDLILLKGLKLFNSLFSITTISPFSTSLTNFASTISNAQVSDAKIYELPNLPITSGLIPRGSLIPINFLFVKITKA